MKKIKFCFLFVLAMFVQVQMMANDVYFKTTQAVVRLGLYHVAVWSWPDGGDGAWSGWMTAVSGQENWYKTTINDSHNKVLFVIFGSSHTAPDWNLINNEDVQSIDFEYSPQNAYFELISQNIKNYSGTYKYYDIANYSSFDGAPPIVETKYSVNLSLTGNGTGSITLYNSGTQVASGASISETLSENSNIRFVLNVNSNSFFRKWSDGDKSLDRTMTLTQNVSLQAEVVKKHHVVLDTDGNGTVTGSGYYTDEDVVITATPNSGYVFDHWSDNNTESTRTLNVTSDVTLTAYFSKSTVIEPCEPSEGDGSKLQPYKLTKACELLWYAQNVGTNDIYAILDADISLGKTTWTPIGSKQNPYKAHFDGRNHYISDFTINADTAGLFGYAQNADIRNIKVRNASVTGSKYAGIICGYAASTDIIACDNWAVVKGQNYTGGVCGYLDNATISTCLNEGEVIATGNFVGGVAGMLNSAIVTSCNNNKSVSAQGDYVGGIAGAVGGTGSSITLCNSSADATVRGRSYVGGLCGNVGNGSTMTESINAGAVYATGQEMGGLIGRFEGSKAQYLENYGYVESTSSQVGGVMGSSKNNSIVESCYNSGTITATQDRHVGGVIGDASATKIVACLNIGQVRGKDLTGGIAGYFYQSSNMICCANYGSVIGQNQVGGLTGEARAKMEKSISTGYVKGTGSLVGGISGNLFQSQYSDGCLYDNQMCTIANAFGSGTGDGEGVSTSELIGTVSVLSGSFNLIGSEKCSWTTDENGYPRPSTLADKPVAAVGASAILLAAGDNADNFAHSATLTKVNNVKWESKGGTQISGTTATPSVKGQDTLYVTKAGYKKVVPLNITGTETIDVKSNDATIKELRINNNVVDEEDGVFAFKVPAAENIAEVEVTFVLANKATASKTSPFKLAVPASSEDPASIATINVTAEDGKTKKVYTVSITRAKEPQDIDNQIVNGQSSNGKFLINGHFYILRDGKIYDMTGKEVK